MSNHSGREVVILSGARTPIGSFEGEIAKLPATELGAVAIRAPCGAPGSMPPRSTRC